jgi:hypothetical protein
VRRKARKRLVREGSPQPTLTAANQEWAVDFAHDALANGCAIRVLTAEDEYTRESLALPVDTSFASRRVTRELETILAERGKPLAIRCYGPEFTSRHFLAWCIGMLFIPTFALCLGVWSGTGKPFEILYTLLWYTGPLHAIPQLDFMGSAPSTAATRYPLIYLALTCVLAVAALAGRKRQLQF